MLRITGLTDFLFLSLFLVSSADADNFGSGSETFTIEFVTIGDPGNPSDTTGDPNPVGAVPYQYRIGKHEISRDMITKANTVGGLDITLIDMTLFGGNGADRPATGVSWTEAAQFVNWLNTDSGSAPAYKFDGSGVFQLWQPGDAGYDPNNLFRNSLATYFLPSVHEWYKAAYYDSSSNVYHDYPTGSDTSPMLVASGTAPGTAVYGQPLLSGPADIALAGGLSPYGTLGQGGNVSEWEETETDLVNDLTSSGHGFRGGAWSSNSSQLLSSARVINVPVGGSGEIGFRVASIAIPEPATSALVLAVALFFIGRRLPTKSGGKVADAIA